MKKTLVFLLILLSAVKLEAQKADATLNDRGLIIRTIQSAYVDGLQNEGDTVKINKGFHPDFELLIPGKEGQLKKYSLKEWKEKIKADLASGKLPRKKEDRVSVKFLQVDITGNAGMAKFEFYVGDKLTFIDYQFLYKYGNDWKIVSKIFYKF